MTTNGDWNRVAVRELYRRNEHAREFLDDCANRGRNFNGYETSVDDLESEGWDRPTARATLKELERCGCGEFKIGRRTKRSRLIWRYSAIEVGKDAQKAGGAAGTKSDSNEGPPASAKVATSGNGGPVEYKPYTILIRPDVTVTVTVPMDLTKEEAERVGEIAKNTYFNRGS